MNIPVGFDDFLEWLRRETEKAWKSYEPRTLEDYQAANVGGVDWQTGTKWGPGLSEAEIAEAEQRFGLQFPPDYRQFLAILHAPDKPMSGALFEGSDLVASNSPSFYNWKTDEDEIRWALSWPIKGILFDVEHNKLWLAEWGQRPDTEQKRASLIKNLAAEATPLIPVFGHRYLVGSPLESGNPVLSMYQADIIAYGQDLRSYLITELAKILGIDHDAAYRDGVCNVSLEDLASIKFWGPIIVANNS